ncbi:MAG TPA: PilZ domain-containing protein [Geobacteraceae bacterium]|nr:PilZ domain-containing protein [Geobacteraceae bacterium]
MQRHYQLVTVETIQKDEETILEFLSSAGNDIRLLNYYRELPVSFDASVVHCDRGVVEINIHDLQAAAMMGQKDVFIKCKVLPHDVIAKVMKIRKPSKTALLTDFHYIIISAERRVCVRVRVSEHYEVTFRHENRLIHGVIEDISFSGLSFSTPKEVALEENIEGLVSISLSDIVLELRGKILKASHNASSANFVIELELDGKSEKLISQFIFAQQSQIIRELKELYDSGPDTILL